MSIVIGFRCVDGIMLCADTQETQSGYIKKKQPKIEVRGATADPIGLGFKSAPTPCAVFAGAGDDADLLDSLVDKLWTAMEPKGQEGLDAVIEAAEDELIRQHQRLTSVFPSGVPGTAFLVGIWTEQYKFELVKISGPILKRKVMLESIGCGDILANYITGRLLYPKSWLYLSAPIGLYVIDQVKLFVEGCGGDTQMTLIHDDGQVEYLMSDEAHAEGERIRKIDWAARQMVGLTMQSYGSINQFNQLIEVEVERLRKAVKIEPMPSSPQTSGDQH